MKLVTTRICGLLLLLGIAAPVTALDLPALASDPRGPLNPAERAVMSEWVLAHAAVRAHLGRDRVRVIGIEADRPKTRDGEYRRVTAVLRNYDRGLAHAVEVDLRDGALAIRDVHGLVQPDDAERAAGEALVRADPELRELLERRPELVIGGGFYLRSRVEGDPCGGPSICLLYQLNDPTTLNGPVRRVVVDLSRDLIAHRDMPATTDESRPAPMTDQRAPR